MQAAGTTGRPVNRHSLRDGLHAYTQSPWCAGSLATMVHAARQRRRELDTSFGVSGRCDFTSAAMPFVRTLGSMLRHHHGHRIPTSRVVTIARNAPPQ